MLWSTRKVAEEKGVTAMTVRNAIHSGRLPAIQIIGTGTRIVTHGILPADAREWEPGRHDRRSPHKEKR